MMTMNMIDDEQWGEPTDLELMELEKNENVKDLLFTEECQNCGEEYSLLVVKSVGGDILCPHCGFYYGGSEW